MASIIRLASESDAAAVAAIYRPIVEATATSFELQPPSDARAPNGYVAQPRVAGWWAHLAFTRINIAPTILRKKIEDAREGGAKW
jgi:hypothetical protein